MCSTALPFLGEEGGEGRDDTDAGDDADADASQAGAHTQNRDLVRKALFELQREGQARYYLQQD